MKKVICNYRYWVLWVLGTATILGVMIMPADELPILSWLCVLVLSKLMAFVTGYVFYLLCCRWDKRGRIPELRDLLS